MTLRKQTFLIFGAALVGLLAVLYVFTSDIVLGGFAELEQRDARQNVARALAALASVQTALDSKCGDWANWDDSYTFVQGKNPEFEQVDANDTSFSELGINLMLFFNAQGQLVYGKAFDLQAQRQVPLPLLSEPLTPDHILVKHDSIDSSVSGIWLLPSGPMLVSSRPILTGAGKGPIAGTLIFGRFLDAQEIEQLANITRLSLTFGRLDDPQLASDLKAMGAVLTQDKTLGVATQPLSESTVSGYTLIKDVEGRPALVLRVDMPRSIYALGQASMMYFLIVLVALALVAGTVSWVTYERLALSRRGWRETAERYRRLIDTSPDAIVLTNGEGICRMANPQSISLFGAAGADSIVGSSLAKFLAPEDSPRLAVDLAKAKAKGYLHQSEYRVLHSDGSHLQAEVSFALIAEEQEPSQTWMITLRDITRRKETEEQLRAKVTTMQTLSDIDQAITSTLSLSERLEVILKSACTQVRADMAFVFLLDSAHQELESFAQQGARYPAHWEHIRVRIGQGGAGWIAEKKRPLAIPDVLADARWESLPGHRDEAIASYLGVPLRVQGRVLGVLDVATRARREFTDDEIDSLVVLGGRAAVAIENAQLFDAIRRGAAEFAALYETTRELASQRDVSALLKTIVDRATSLLAAQNGHIYLYDSAREELELVVAKEGFPIQLGARLKKGEGMAGRVAETRRAIMVDDYRAWEHHAAQYAGLSFTSVLQVPMIYQGELIGVLGVNEMQKSGPQIRRFTEADQRALALFAAQAANAVHNARLFQETRTRAEQMALLYDAGLALNSVLEPDAQLQFLLRIAMKALRGDRAVFFRYAPEQKAIHLGQTIGFSEASHQRLSSSPQATDENSIVGWVAQNRLPLNLPCVTADSRWIGVDVTIQSGLWAPVEHERQLRGVIGVMSVQPNAFSAQDERLLVLFANQVSVAIENARLFGQVQHRAERLAVLNRIASAVNHAVHLDDLLHVIHREVTATIAADAFFIALYDPATNELDYRIRVDEGVILPPERRALAAGLSARVVVSKKPLRVTDWEREQAALPAPILWGNMKAPKGWLGVPMLLGGNVVGVICVQSYKPNVYGEEEERLLMTIADQMAVVIDKARLFEGEQTRRSELTALYDLSRTLADTTDFDTILNVISRRAVETLHVTFARIALLEGDSFVLRAAYPIRVLGQDLGIGLCEPVHAQPYCQKVLERNAPALLRVTDEGIGEHEREMLFLKVARTLCLVPLRTNERTIGILMLGEARREEREPFTPEKVRLAHSIGDQAANALRRAELFSELENAYLQTVLSLANAVDAKDTYTADHAQRMARMALAVGSNLGLTPHELEDLRYGALLHDIGKIGIPDDILQKPGPLTPGQWKDMRRHPDIGEQIVMPVPRLAGASRIIRHHHERFDGTGYPAGIAGDAIPIGARILTVIDAYSAIVDQRVYKPAASHEEAILELQRNAGTQFDPQVVSVFLRVMDLEKGGGAAS